MGARGWMVDREVSCNRGILILYSFFYSLYKGNPKRFRFEDMSATRGQVDDVQWQRQQCQGFTESTMQHLSPKRGVGPFEHGTIRVRENNAEKKTNTCRPADDNLYEHVCMHGGAQTTPPQSPSNACKVGRKDESQTTPRAQNHYEKVYGSPSEAGIASFAMVDQPVTPIKNSFSLESMVSDGLCPLPPTASPRKPPRVRIQPSTNSSTALRSPGSPQLQTGLTPMAAQLNLNGLHGASSMFGPSPQASPRAGPLPPSSYQQSSQQNFITESTYFRPVQSYWWNTDPAAGMPRPGADCPAGYAIRPVQPSGAQSHNSIASHSPGLVPLNLAPLLASQEQQQRQQQPAEDAVPLYHHYQQCQASSGPLASGVYGGTGQHVLQPNLVWPATYQNIRQEQRGMVDAQYPNIQNVFHAAAVDFGKDDVHCPPPCQVLHRSPNMDETKTNGSRTTRHTPTPVTPALRQGPAQLKGEGRSLKKGLPSVVALQNFGHLLTPYEKGEILLYQEVWYVGKPGCRKLRGPPQCKAHCQASIDGNTEYDDSRGDYRVMMGDHVRYRYEIIGTLGKGSFGQVLKCVDHATGTTVALKVIRNKKRFQKQARVEASLLGTLMAHMPEEEDGDGPLGIVQMLDHFVFRSHLCITFELLGANLYEHIKAGGFAGCSLDLVWSVGAQVIRTLSFLKSLNIVHCDLKPENILLPASVTPGSEPSPSRTRVKVIDFGSSCYVDQRVFTYIQSRFYRAPEVILGLAYGSAIDMWSIACVLAELLTGTPLFPGEDETEQVACITEILGPPPLKLLKGGSRSSLFFDMDSGAPRAAPPNSQGKVHRPGSITLETALRGRGSILFLDFLKKCLHWDPEDRLTPDQALQHPWLAASPNQQEQQQASDSQRDVRSSVMRYLVPKKSSKTNACSGKGPLGSAAAALGINIF